MYFVMELNIHNRKDQKKLDLNLVLNVTILRSYDQVFFPNFFLCTLMVTKEINSIF
jgi:hypothetical protein